MLLRVALFISVLFGLAGLGGVAYLGTRTPEVAQQVVAPVVPLAPPPPARATVVVAAHPLRAGTLLKAEDLNVAEVPADEQTANVVPGTREKRSELVGAMLRRSLQPTDPVLSTDVMLPGDRGFLAAVLSPGMRATTIAVDPVSGLAGLIWPGDRVDVVLTQASDDASLTAGRKLTGERVLDNVRVVAVDQSIIRGAVAGQDVPAAHTLTLEVSPDQAEKLAVAVRLGKISLLVRSGDKSDAVTEVDPNQGLTYATDVSRAFPKDSGHSGVVKIFTGPSDGKEFKFQ
jgi:pilus assembly protein CpaB